MMKIMISFLIQVCMFMVVWFRNLSTVLKKNWSNDRSDFGEFCLSFSASSYSFFPIEQRALVNSKHNSSDLSSPAFGP